VSIEILPILSIMRFKQTENDTNSVVIAKVALVPNHNWTVTAPLLKLCRHTGWPKNLAQLFCTP